jgi:very-short-patch-repair endonuclease
MSRRTDLPRIIRHAASDSDKLLLAKQFRRTPTAAEALGWKLLRNRALFGLKFRRQQTIAGFIVDFYCASARLAVELDGGVHQDAARREYDEERTRVLACHGVRVLRIANQDIHEQALRDLLAPYAVADSPA